MIGATEARLMSQKNFAFTGNIAEFIETQIKKACTDGKYECEFTLSMSDKNAKKVAEHLRKRGGYQVFVDDNQWRVSWR